MFKSLFNSQEKEIKKLTPVVDQVNSYEDEFEKLSHEQVLEKTTAWKSELARMSKEEQEKYLNEILPEAYALVRQAAKKVLGQRAFDAQVMAAITLHQGKITEQKTGEGKTLTATMPLYLNSLTGRGVHLVTPNDYLSRHGVGWMGPVYTYLGVRASTIMQERAFVYDENFEGHEFQDEYAIHLKESSRQEAYKCDITYGTNHEFGFDYLRDNMARRFEDIVQTNPIGEWGIHNFAIVDEVDSILIDVARTPLIISTSAAKPSERYHNASSIVSSLIKDTDYELDEKYKTAVLTDLGIRKVEKMLGISNLYEQDFEMVHLIEQALAAHTLYEKDRDYVVKNGAVVIVDQFTGRLLPNNRYSHGLHQAIEAKENVQIQQESQTLAEISYQNYFRMYEKLAGMTGTAATEAEEFYKIYGLDVVVIPTNRPVARKDYPDIVYKTEAAKFRAVADEITEKNKKGQPVLVGTTSVEKSQMLHELLQRRGVHHEILNAKNHEKEALIIAQAGSKGAVTVSTNMAGRGVDIKLGGDPGTAEQYEEIKSLGGLHVIGTERHDSRRIDNQLRGRSGRQGDPGSSRFYVSLRDDLMRIFGGMQVERLMDKFGIDESVPLESGLVTKAIENAQKKVEGFNFDRRKQVVEMDDVINVHRDVIYGLRRKILGASEEDGFENWFLGRLSQYTDFDAQKSWDPRKEDLGEKTWFGIVSQLSLPVIDLLWMEHIADMDQVREGIGLRGYAQRDPIVEYKRESHDRFGNLVARIFSVIAERISNIEDISRVSEQKKVVDMSRVSYAKGEFESGVSDEGNVLQTVPGAPKVEPVKSGQKKVGRNDPCPCGSGKKYKHCCGK